MTRRRTKRRKGSWAQVGCNTTVFGGHRHDAPEETELPDLNNSRYEVIAEIGGGGVGLIFLARDLMLDRDVAVKVLRKSFASLPEIHSAFRNESRLMSFLTHPGVPPIFESGVTADERPYHVMKFVRGKTLTRILDEGVSTAAELLAVFADICQTMAFAHSSDVLHLDLKPANIMVGAFGEVHVMDWGLAQFLKRRRSRRDRENQTPAPVHGTPMYMSPEMALGRTPDARADVFGLGAILCELLTGQAPYAGDDIEKVYRDAKTVTMDAALRTLDECDTDRAMVRLAKRCLAPRRGDRPNSAIDVARDVADYQEAVLQQAESDMNRFFELSLDLFCIAGIDGYFRRINSNFTKVLGYSESELLSRPFLDLIHVDDRQATIDRMSVLNHGEPVVRFRNRYLTVWGNYVTLEWTAKSIAQESIIFAVARDVSDET